MTKFKKDLQPLIFKTEWNKCYKPTSDDVIAQLLPKLQQVTDDEDILHCPKYYKLMKVMTYAPSGDKVFCPLRSSNFFSGYFACVPEKIGLQDYKKQYKTAKVSYNFLFFCLLMLEQRLNQADYFIETKDYNQTDYPLWIWTTYNVLCYHCILFKDYEMTVTVCSLLEDFLSGFLEKVTGEVQGNEQ